jgi:hypothetical protein
LVAVLTLIFVVVLNLVFIVALDLGFVVFPTPMVAVLTSMVVVITFGHVVAPISMIIGFHDIWVAFMVTVAVSVAIAAGDGGSSLLILAPVVVPPRVNGW